jgi:hypothetical protein
MFHYFTNNLLLRCLFSQLDQAQFGELINGGLDICQQVSLRRIKLATQGLGHLRNGLLAITEIPNGFG